MFEIDFSLEGYEELVRNLDRADVNVTRALTVAQEENAEDLRGAAVELAPIDTGALRRSSEAHIEHTASGVDGVVTFNTPYAVRRHEEAPRMGVHPRYTRRGGKWVRAGEYIDGRGPQTRSAPGIDGMEPGRKYLERPLRRRASKYMQNIAKHVKGVLG